MRRILLTLFLAILSALVFIGCSQKISGESHSDILAQAWRCYRLGEFNRAEAGFRFLLDDKSISKDMKVQALYGLATTWNLRRPGEDTVKAAKFFEEAIAIDPVGDLAPWCYLALTRMKHLVPVGKDPDYPEVRKSYQEVIDRFPNHLAGEEAFVYQQSTLLLDIDDTNSLRQALETLQEFVEQHSESHFLSPAYALISQAHQWLGEYDEALATKIKALEHTEIDKDNPKQEFSGAYWSIAVMAEFDCGDFETARKYYKCLLDEYPMDQRGHGVRQALKRMDKMESDIRKELGLPEKGGAE